MPRGFKALWSRFLTPSLSLNNPLIRPYFLGCGVWWQWGGVSFNSPWCWFSFAKPPTTLPWQGTLVYEAIAASWQKIEEKAGQKQASPKILCNLARWWFQTFFIFIPIPGKMIQFDLRIFFKWVELKPPSSWELSLKKDSPSLKHIGH